MRTGWMALAVAAAVMTVPGTAAGQQRATSRARVSVHVVPAAVPFATIDSAVTRAAADSTPRARWLPAGARLDLADVHADPAPSVTRLAQPQRARAVRRITLEYVAN